MHITNHLSKLLRWTKGLSDEEQFLGTSMIWTNYLIPDYPMHGPSYTIIVDSVVSFIAYSLNNDLWYE